MLDLELLMMYFEELYEEVDDAITFDEWSASVGYTTSWDDATIYTSLPQYVKDALLDIVMNESWYHDGM